MQVRLIPVPACTVEGRTGRGRTGAGFEAEMNLLRSFATHRLSLDDLLRVGGCTRKQQRRQRGLPSRVVGVNKAHLLVVYSLWYALSDDANAVDAHYSFKHFDPPPLMG